MKRNRWKLILDDGGQSQGCSDDVEEHVHEVSAIDSQDV